MGLRREGEGSGQGAWAGPCALTCTDPTEHRKALAVVVSAVCDVCMWLTVRYTSKSYRKSFYTIRYLSSLLLRHDGSAAHARI